jgi:hypothetical protein
LEVSVVAPSALSITIWMRSPGHRSGYGLRG